MKVIIAGCRHFTHSNFVFIVNEAIKESGFEVTEVISGGAKGIDTIGEKWADMNGIPKKVFKADWNKYKFSAGPIRNKIMGNYAKKYDGGLIAIWDGKSSGTKNMMACANRLGLKTHLCIIEEDPFKKKKTSE